MLVCERSFRSTVYSKMTEGRVREVVRDSAVALFSFRGLCYAPCTYAAPSHHPTPFPTPAYAGVFPLQLPLAAGVLGFTTPTSCGLLRPGADPASCVRRSRDADRRRAAVYSILSRFCVLSLSYCMQASPFPSGSRPCFPPCVRKGFPTFRLTGGAPIGRPAAPFFACPFPLTLIPSSCWRSDSLSSPDMAGCESAASTSTVGGAGASKRPRRPEWTANHTERGLKSLGLRVDCGSSMSHVRFLALKTDMLDGHRSVPFRGKGPRLFAGPDVCGAPGNADDVARPGLDRWLCSCLLGS